jgi:TPR repeat protein
MRNYLQAPILLLAFFGATASFPQSSPPEDKNSATNTLKRCEAGEALGCEQVALNYASGSKGVAKNLVKAAFYYDKACKGGESYSCSSLATMYRDGEGVKKSLSKSLSYDNKACDGGSSYSCSDLGSRYGYGRGVKKDIPKAIAYLKRAVDLNPDNIPAVMQLEELQKEQK